LAAPEVTLTASAQVTTQGGMPGGQGAPGEGNGGLGGIGRIRIAADSFSADPAAQLVPSLGTNATGETFVTRFTPELRFDSGPSTVPVGKPSALITVSVQDNEGETYSAPPGGLQLYLSSSAVTGSFLDAAGTSTITSVTVPEGGSTASFRYKDSAAGTRTLTVSDQVGAPDTGFTDAQRAIVPQKIPIGGSVKLTHSRSPHLFKGRVTSSASVCRSSRKVEIRKVGGKVVARPTTRADGTFRVRHRTGGRGRYVASALKKETSAVICKVLTSPRLRVPR
jgi:hypothetical protein